MTDLSSIRNINLDEVSSNISDEDAKSIVSSLKDAEMYRYFDNTINIIMHRDFVPTHYDLWCIINIIEHTDWLCQYLVYRPHVEEIRFLKRDRIRLIISGGWDKDLYDGVKEIGHILD